MKMFDNYVENVKFKANKEIVFEGDNFLIFRYIGL